MTNIDFDELKRQILAIPLTISAYDSDSDSDVGYNGLVYDEDEAVTNLKTTDSLDKIVYNQLFQCDNQKGLDLFYRLLESGKTYKYFHELSSKEVDKLVQTVQDFYTEYLAIKTDLIAKQ